MCDFAPDVCDFTPDVRDFAPPVQDFHPRLSFVVHTLQLYGMGLLHFLFVVLYLVIVQGFMMNLYFGPFFKRCSTLTDAILYTMDLNVDPMVQIESLPDIEELTNMVSQWCEGQGYIPAP